MIKHSLKPTIRKVRLTGLVLISLVHILSAQVVFTDPYYATEQDSITLYFDATLGNAGLKDYTGDVYAHTGVITDYSTSPSDWKYVVTPWADKPGANTSKNKLERDATNSNLYKLTIGYPRDYYVSHENGATIPAGEKILKLAFVFRNADGSKSGRDIGGNDIFYDLYEAGLSVVISAPNIDLSFTDPRRSPVFADRSDTIAVKINTAALGTEIDTLKLFINDQLIVQVNDTAMNYNFIATEHNYGMNDLMAIGKDTTGVCDTAGFAIMVNQPVSYASRPESVLDGVNIAGDSGVIFSLQAPYKDFVYLIGDFNDWTVDSSYYMKCEDNGGTDVHWWLAVDGFDPQTEYAFQYFVDGEIRIADPYSEKILDPWNDSYIPASVYPDLKAYPTGKTSEIVGTFQIEKPEYPWQTTDYIRPPKTDLIIYEMLIRDFVAAHDYKTLIDTLAYLQNLGVNAIELMPISEFEGNSSWGYNPSFYFAVDKYYGPADDFKQFVDSCHARGMAVIQDIVLNHSYGSAPLVRLYWDSANNRPTAENPWYNQISPNTTYSWGYDFNHESQDTKNFVDRVTRYWLINYRVDGFRFDFTKGFTNKSGEGTPYDDSRIAILERLADKVWEVDSNTFVILEHFADNSEEKILADYGMMLWGNSNWNYAQSAMGYPDQSDFSWGFYKNRSWTKPGLVTYMESHDEERLMYKNLTYGNSSGSYSVKTLSTALERMKMTAAFFLTLPGPKMIWQFGELGYDISIDDPCRVCEKPIRWDYLQDPNRLRLYKTFRALLKLRMENDVFTSASTSLDMTLGGNVKRIAMTGSMNVIIIGNFGVTITTTNPSFQHGGVWYDYFSGESMTATGTDTLTLVPGEFHIFTDQRLETPEEGLLGIKGYVTDAFTKKFKIYPNYPNPFNSSTTIEYDLENTSAVQLSIFDLLGREIFSEKFGNQSPGKYQFVWNCLDKSGLEARSGIYFIMLQRGHERQIVKMTLLK